MTCASLHLGEIRPGTFRGNHRHYSCNETFVIWGARTKFRVSCFSSDPNLVSYIFSSKSTYVNSRMWMNINLHQQYLDVHTSQKKRKREKIRGGGEERLSFIIRDIVDNNMK